MRTKKKINNEIICVMCCYNEEKNLRDCILSLSPYVDQFVIYDDGSTDNSIASIKDLPKVTKIIENKEKEGWMERNNRKVLLEEAKKLSKYDNPWVLCVDPDERFEERFLKKLRKITRKYNDLDIVLHVKFRELWNDLDHYRVDYVWNTKNKGLLFKLSNKMTFDYSQEHHIPWAYREIVNNTKFLNYNLYHLKMIKEQDRIDRKNLYNKLDPNKKMQKIGYDYLVDEENIKLRKVNFINKFNLEYVPDYYKRKN